MIIAGAKDPGTPGAAMQAIRGRIAGSKLEIIPHCLHQTPIEAPDMFNKLVAQFLAAHDNK